LDIVTTAVSDQVKELQQRILLILEMGCGELGTPQGYDMQAALGAAVKEVALATTNGPEGDGERITMLRLEAAEVIEYFNDPTVSVADLMFLFGECIASVSESWRRDEEYGGHA